MTTKLKLSATSSLADWFSVWDAQREVSETRQRADRSRFHKYLLKPFGQRQIARITEPQIEKFIKDLLEAGVGPFTVDAVLGVLRGILQTAVDLEVLRRNPAAGIAVDAAPAALQVDIADTFTREETRRLEKSIDLPYAAVIHLASTLGLSRGDILGIQKDDVDLYGKRLTVGANVLREASGKTTLVDGKPRVLEMSDETTAVLGLHLAATEHARNVAYRRLGAEPIFVNERGNFPFLQNLTQYHLRPALEEAGLDTTATLQTLRYSGMRYLIENGATVDDIVRICGYSDVKSTKFALKHLFSAFSPAQ